MARLGANSNERTSLEPLNLSQARKLELASKFYDIPPSSPASPAASGKGLLPNRPRSKTTNLADVTHLTDFNAENDQNIFGNFNFNMKAPSPPLLEATGSGRHYVSIEQLVSVTHISADGVARTPRKPVPVDARRADEKQI